MTSIESTTLITHDNYKDYLLKLFTPDNKISFIVEDDKVKIESKGDDLFRFDHYIIGLYLDKVYALSHKIPIKYRDQEALELKNISNAPKILEFKDNLMKHSIINNINRKMLLKMDTLPSKPLRDIIKERSKIISTKFSKEELEKLEKESPDIREYFEESGGLRFELTKRPITLMRELRTNTDKSYKGKFFPVIRYSGLYYSNNPTEQKFCGKFYYYEPESMIFLYLGNYRIFGSKVSAYLELLKLSNEANVSKKEIINNILDIPGINYLKRAKKLPINTSEYNNTFFEEYLKPYYYTLLRNEDDIEYFPKIETTSLYPIDSSKYWNKKNMSPGLHDFLDQPLCNLARELNIDTIILQHEIGEFRAVSEILDMRENTYDYLVKMQAEREENIENRCWNPDIKYTTIWFTDYGFYDEKGKCIK
jgi:hypothetical protein